MIINTLKKIKTDWGKTPNLSAFYSNFHVASLRTNFRTHLLPPCLRLSSSEYLLSLWCSCTLFTNPIPTLYIASSKIIIGDWHYTSFASHLPETVDLRITKFIREMSSSLAKVGRLPESLKKVSPLDKLAVMGTTELFRRADPFVKMMALIICRYW